MGHRHSRHHVGGVSDGPWSTSLDTGSSEGGPYLRARIAVHGLLALSREETVYYSALRDSDGADLVGNCSYRLEGRDPPTRWWSITAYGADDFLIPNDGQPLFRFEELGCAQR